MNQDDWYKAWKIHLEKYLESPPRTGIYIYAYLPCIHRSLEIACGSSRDSIFLAEKGVHATASDYEVRLIEDLKKRFSHPNLSYKQADAFCLSFGPDSFDIVFHNGFFVCFKSNKDILELLAEQARVSSKYIVFFVHNKLNYNLVRTFERLARSDPLYDIRFFDPIEVEDIVKSSCINLRSVKILKFGGTFDIFYSRRLKKFTTNIFLSFRCKMIPKLYQYQSWKQTERVACIIELNK